MEETKNGKFNYKNLILIIFVFLIGFVGGGYFFQAKKIELIEGANFIPFYEAWSQVKNKFYDYSPQKDQDMIYGAIDGMVRGLKDPYSDFLTPQETKALESELEGEYEGIGVEIAIKDNVLTIVAPLKNTPAEKAGLLPGDNILEINGEDTSKMTLVEAVMKIRGKAGEIVDLKIKRGEKVFNVKIKRVRVEIPVIDFKMLDNDIAYIQIFNFYESTFPKFQAVSEDILKRGTKKIILDLRDNPGGFLKSAVDIAGFFIPEGKTVLKQDFGKGKIDEIKSFGPGSFSNFKIVILINKGSASASEILAGAIKENNKENVILVGEKTFGKGTVQELVNLSDNSSLKITVAHWLLPSGILIEGKGIKPDKEVKMTEEDIKKKQDPQLEEAKRILK